MEGRKILVVNDDEELRLTLERALEPLGYEIALAASGQEALDQLEDPDLSLVLLDLQMRGVGGLDVLRQIERERPDLRVVILAEDGTVEQAVESMKHGAADVLQKPFRMEQIRELVEGALDPAERKALRAADYTREIDAAKEAIREGAFDAALAHLREASGTEPGRPEAENLIGAIHELRHERSEAQKHYRLALDLDPTYRPARENLEKSAGARARRGAILLGDEEGDRTDAPEGR